MRAVPAAASLVLLGACAPGGGDGLIPAGEAEIQARLGVPAAAVILSGSQRQPDGHWREYVQIDMTGITPDVLAAIPAHLCAQDQAGVASSGVIEPDSHFVDRPGSKVVVAECDPTTGELQ